MNILSLAFAILRLSCRLETPDDVPRLELVRFRPFLPHPRTVRYVDRSSKILSYQMRRHHPPSRSAPNQCDTARCTEHAKIPREPRHQPWHHSLLRCSTIVEQARPCTTVRGKNLSGQLFPTLAHDNLIHEVHQRLQRRPTSWLRSWPNAGNILAEIFTPVIEYVANCGLDTWRRL